MFLLVAIMLGLGCGLTVQRGSLANMAQWRFRAVPVALGALLIQVVIFSEQWQASWGSAAWTGYLYVASMALLLLTAVRNVAAPGMPIVGLGILLNLIVIAANGGHMPALLTSVAIAGDLQRLAALQGGTLYNNSVALVSASALPFLSDIFVLPPPFPLPNVFSIGDFFIAAGGFLLAAGIVCPRQACHQANVAAISRVGGES